MKFLSKYSSSRWDLAFIIENPYDIVKSKPIHFIEPENPYRDKCWFADPFILDVTDTHIYLLVEEFHNDVKKGRIAKLTVDRNIWKITDVEIILEESWHLSFPFIIRENGKIFVAPESANSKAWFLYELITDSNGHSKLIRKQTLCDDIIWDSVITNHFEQPLLFTCAQNDFNLDIYKFDSESQKFTFSESIVSKRQNMRMAGNLFQIGNDIYCPSQVSRPGAYGEYVELKRITHINNSWCLDSIRTIKPPKNNFLNDGLHTFNTYKGVTVIDIHRQNSLLSLLIKYLVILKKKQQKK